ncbi:MAG: flagellar biosynthesis protein FlgL [Geobacteraceae bacterium GWC2_58_44]|nr:MAG: flagellar biosynthesis protein FlgL [Geobacteraceae bacterium GWC2_58_44]
MRITPGMTADNAIYNLQQGRSAMETLQEQISSGSMVNRPSDDPLTTRQLLDLQNQISAGDQYSSNITKGELFLNITNTALTGMSALMQQVKKIAGDMASGSTDAATKAGAVSNLTQLREQLIDLGNTRIGDQYVFAGFSNSQPFDLLGNFSGTDDSLDLEIAQGSRVATNVSGGNLLRGGTPPGSLGVDILGGIEALISAISADDTAGIGTGITNMKEGAERIAANQAEVAGRLVRMDNMKGMIANNQNTLKSIYGDLQNVDYARAGVELSQQTTAFTAALSTTAKLTQLSLLDYMK